MNQYAAQMQVWEAEMGEYGEEMQQWEQEMTQYKAVLEDYQDAVSQYQDAMEVWQTDYKNWKESRDTAVGKAEAVVSHALDEWGNAFNVNIFGHWLAIIIITGATLILLVIVMRVRDRKK